MRRLVLIDVEVSAREPRHCAPTCRHLRRHKTADKKVPSVVACSLFETRLKFEGAFLRTGRCLDSEER